MAAPIRFYNFDVWGADSAGEKRHPSIVIRELFPDAFDIEGHAIGDCFLFQAPERGDIPEYIRQLPDESHQRRIAEINEIMARKASR